MITIHYQGNRNNKYNEAKLNGDIREVLRKLHSWQLWNPNDAGEQELILPHRVTAIVISDEGD